MMDRRQFLGGAVSLAAAAFVGTAEGETAPAAPVEQPSRVRFVKRTINAESDFEAACAADINGDGRLDIVSGDTWYEAPLWTPHHFRDIGDWGRGPGSSGYRRDFADIPFDVDGDGKIDIVSVDYASGEIAWSQNTGLNGPAWPRTLVGTPGSMETAAAVPFLGPRTLCILPNCGGEVVWYELRTPGPKPEWIEHHVGKQGAAHGIGWGDVNGDGKIDITTPHGWYEQVDAKNDQWTWHGDWECNPGDCSINMPVMDVDGDGRRDVLFGSGHHYGLYWLQQAPAGSTPRWVQHTIDPTGSQWHTLILADLERRGQPVLVTGKRYRAHDHDPGVDEPLGVYYYRFDRRQGAWQKYVIDKGTKTGTGLQLTAVDLRRTGHLDLITPGKSGLYLFENHGRG